MIDKATCKFLIQDSLNFIVDQMESIIKSSPDLLPESPSLEDISVYTHAVTNLDYALQDIKRARDRFELIRADSGKEGKK